MAYEEFTGDVISPPLVAAPRNDVNPSKFTLKNPAEMVAVSPIYPWNQGGTVSKRPSRGIVYP